ncbi:MAG: hypothetical protein HYX50_00330 [Chloroflexi bacterium]|nr:hypothetical protein [Chloroflexota bacterium]
MTRIDRWGDTDVIHLTAVEPDGSLACDFTIATEIARSGFRDRFRESITAVADREDGVAVTLKPEAWDAVLAYIDLESRCCTFINFAAQREPDGVQLTLTGRPDAVPTIRAIFTDVPDQ